MVQEFEIIKVVDITDCGQLILARQVNAGQDFDVKEGLILGGIPLDRYLDIPRMLDKKGQPRLDVFVFRPLARISADSVAAPMVQRCCKAKMRFVHLVI